MKQIHVPLVDAYIVGVHGLILYQCWSMPRINVLHNPIEELTQNIKLGYHISISATDNSPNEKLFHRIFRVVGKMYATMCF